jgi:hypothetical protein
VCEEGVGRVEGLREGLRGVGRGGEGGGGREGGGERGGWEEFGWKEFELLDKGSRLEPGLFSRFSAA